jgi:membrane protein YdbS with pleckstrin-like domain
MHANPKTESAGSSIRRYAVRLMAGARRKLRTVGALVMELLQYMNQDKLWWISPIVALLVIVSVFLILIEGSAVAPFIYAMF